MKISINKKHKKIFYNFLGLIFIFLIWFILSNIYNNSLVIPKIEEVFGSLFKLLSTSRFYMLFFTMIFRIMLTVIISLIVATLLAMICFKSERIYNFLNPMITIMKTMPIIAIIILLLLSIGMGLAPYVATSFVIMPLIFEMVYASFKDINPTITDDIKTVSNVNLNVLLKFYLPLILPSIVTSLIQSFGLGLKVMLMAEFISPRRNTFGAEISTYYNNLQMPEVYAIILVVVIVVFILDKLLKVFREKKQFN